VRDLAHLVMIDEDHCYVIGRGEIAMLEWKEGKWIEPVPRIAGLSNPAIVHQVKDSVWIEMGGDGVARLWTHDGHLQVDRVRNETWTTASWVNVGCVGNIVVLSALQEQPRRFFDQSTGQWVNNPALQQLFDRSPYWIARMEMDRNGVIWASHNEGLIRFAPNGHGYDMDPSNFDLVNDRYPVVHILPDNEVWASAERSLYHIERGWISDAVAVPKPMLVSVVDLKKNLEVLGRTPGAISSRPLPYEQNSLSFRFFSGTDSWRRAPVYEYRLGMNESWASIDGSALSLRNLREGNYHLQVRVASTRASSEIVSNYDFEILPPWYRSRLAYIIFATAFLLALAGLIRWSVYLERRRNRALEKVVHERTGQLKVAMTKLSEETRKAATLAERDRLANEIHDSVQQGLTGAILQLETTLKSSHIDSDLRSRLDVVRKMVSYARQEVQHAVWDMESPLLEGTELPAALKNLVSFVNSDGVSIEVLVVGRPVPLERSLNHNLLRIAQEATTNAFRHAKAEKIVIRLEYLEGRMILEISDDGVGFSSGEVLQRKGGHLGLRGIRTRVKKFGGQLEIQSEPNRGTSIRVQVPIAKAETISINAEAQSIS
jgi:signal transduction histidine kinase